MIQTRFNSPLLKSVRPAASYSRSTKVLEQLQENLDSIQAEIETTKHQLQAAREAKEQKEQENETFVESNRQLRADIQEVMQILESKQQLLDSTKKVHFSTEAQVRQLKNEAMAARRELDDLKRREHTIEKERHMIQLQKEKQVQQQALLAKSVSQCQAEFDKSMEAMQAELNTILAEIERVKAVDVVKLVQKSIQKQAKQRRLLVDEFSQIQSDIEQSNQSFMDHIKNELTALLNDVSTHTQDPVEEQVTHCQQDFHQLMSRIKANTILT